MAPQLDNQDPENKVRKLFCGSMRKKRRPSMWTLQQQQRLWPAVPRRVDLLLWLNSHRYSLVWGLEQNLMDRREICVRVREREHPCLHVPALSQAHTCLSELSIYMQSVCSFVIFQLAILIAALSWETQLSRCSLTSCYGNWLWSAVTIWWHTILSHKHYTTAPHFWTIKYWSP